jgi:predicted P-loop ATPase
LAAKTNSPGGIAYLDKRRKFSGLELILDKQGRPKGCEHNAKQLLGADPRYSNVYWDEFHGRLRCDERDWTDYDDLVALNSLQAEHQVASFTPGHVRRAVLTLAQERRRDSLQQYVKNLPPWDGTPRIELAFVEAWGAPDTPLTRAASRNFFLSMIARALRPGAQVDTLWALEGRQGTLKSRSLRALGGDRHAEISAPIGSADFSRELRGVWLAELSELDSLRGREASTVKRILSGVKDRYIEKYQVHAVTYPRRTVFLATTNEANYWQDSTGARRLVPVKIGEIELVMIENSREQWFAEARTLFDKGATWWEFPAEIEVAQEERQSVDPWEDLLRGLVAHGRIGAFGELIPWPDGFVASADIMHEWLKLASHQLGQSSGSRLGRVMKRLGFEPARQGKARDRGWVRADTGARHA